MKIPFDIKYRPQIESGEYKVETRDGMSVRIVCWDRRYNDQHKAGDIIGLVDDGYGEAAYYFNLNGTHWNNNVDKNGRSNFDLFIITPEPGLSEFEDKLRIICENAVKEAYLSPCCTSEDFAKNHAAELLELARKEIMDGWTHGLRDTQDSSGKAYNDGYQLGFERGKAEALKTHATELTENLINSGLDKYSIPYQLIEFMCNLYTCQNWKEIEKTAEAYVARFKAASLKDLPRWRKWENGACGNGQGIPIAIVKRGLNGYELVDALGIQGEQYIMLSDLEKLPKDE